MNEKTSLTNQTRKYIVEGPVPQNGQKLGSGGIRENGKIKSLYKNPVPYEENKPQRITYSYEQSSIKSEIRELLVEELVYFGMDCLSLFWKEYGRPVLKDLFSQSYQERKTSSDSPRNSNSRKLNFKCYEILENNKSSEKEQVITDINIIPFPQKRKII